MRRPLFAAALAFASCLCAFGARAEEPLVSSSDTDVVVYEAGWCSACRALESDLRARKIPFSEIDVDANPRAFERAKQATGESAIPQTSVSTGSGVEWIVGADGAAVERAYRKR